MTRRSPPRRSARASKRKPAASKNRGRLRNAGPAAAARILELLEQAHPDARCELHYGNPYELVTATILSAQCTDKRVNEVTPALFARYPSAALLARAAARELEEMIRSTGFFRAKARSLIGCAKALVDRHGSEVPRSLDALVELPGIGRKTANVVLGHAYGINEGIAVDTHVNRVANRLGLVRERDPEKIEAQLMRYVPRERWTRTTDLLIFHGRRICDARRPACGRCPLFALCGFEDKQAHALAAAPRARRAPARASA